MQKSTHSKQYKGMHHATRNDVAGEKNQQKANLLVAFMHVVYVLHGAYMMVAPAMQQCELPSIPMICGARS